MRDSRRLALTNIFITGAACRTAAHAGTVVDAQKAFIVAGGITFDLSVRQTGVVAIRQCLFNIFNTISVFKLVSVNARIVRAERVITASAAIWAINVARTFRFAKHISQVTFFLASSSRAVLYACEKVFLAIRLAKIG